MLWLLAFHLIFMVTWFAGLFYLPRLFIYHREALGSGDSAACARFEKMERRLYTIMSIGAVATIGFGVALLAGWFWPLPGWLIAKLVLVAALLLYHLYCRRLIAHLARGRCPHSDKFLRYFNELPGLFLLVIVILAVVRPF
ncbi:MAG: CopD family protein [Gammaproteobacteria bacterium]|nr:CopD family protein [Gammaproteobacteria bacterium]